MKKVFRNSAEVIHVFAGRRQDEGRSGNVFFYGDKIYSYGYHYLLGEFITNSRDEHAIMINDRGYSQTTSKHIREITSGTRQYKQFFTTQTDPKQVLDQLTMLSFKLINARKPELYILPAETLYEKYCEYNQWRGSEPNDTESHLGINAIIEVFRGKDYNEYLTEKEQVIETARIQKEEALRRRHEKELDEFFAYERYSLSVSTGEDFVRISRDRTMVETTQRVRVSIESAQTLYRLIKAGKDIKGHQIEGYTVISLNGTLQIGCHRINTQNMKQVGEEILKLI